MNDNLQENSGPDGSEEPLQWQCPLEVNEEIFQEVLRKDREERLRNGAQHPDYFSLNDPDLED